MKKVSNWLQPDTLDQLTGWARQGLCDREIAQRMDVRPETLSRWRKAHVAIGQAIDQGRDDTTRTVEGALLRRALGYETLESRKTTDRTGKDSEVLTIKSVPPDVGALKFWLVNRAPERWRDKGGPQPEARSDGDGPLIEALQRTAERAWGKKAAEEYPER